MHARPVTLGYSLRSSSQTRIAMLENLTELMWNLAELDEIWQKLYRTCTCVESGETLWNLGRTCVEPRKTWRNLIKVCETWQNLHRNLWNLTELAYNLVEPQVKLGRTW